MYMRTTHYTIGIQKHGTLAGRTDATTIIIIRTSYYTQPSVIGCVLLLYHCGPGRN